MSIPILSVKDDKGNIIPIPGIKGDKGDPGVSGVYTESGEMPDGYNIQIDPNGDEYFEVEQIFNPESINPQSGKAVAEALATVKTTEGWEQIADTTLEENAVLNITQDINGNSFALKKFIVILNKSAVEGNTTKGYPWVYAKTTNRTTYTPFVAVEGGASYADNVASAWRYEGEIKHAWQATWRAGQDSSDNTLYAYGDYMAKLGIRTEFRNDNTPLTAFRFTWTYSGALPIGTRVQIWGVRA